ncbi:steroid 5-alpha reductase family enzyme [Parvibaculum indicum]|uniref:DUF1295 domain-containing protein n=1 Tax=Parvibaculum TaxID=256616 RepID=UPI000C94165A|nr:MULTISPECIES: DUF1295 domain-containing protein [Parvibaculum]MAB13253.1 hypothetical protein [Parvibaculum sp.]NIJ41593.1 steroid 5-alpha reductase family enzyme [Parvibaculum indicum]
MAEVLGLIAVSVSGAMLLAWAVQGVTKHGGAVDVVWSLATGLACVAAALFPHEGGLSERQLLIAVLAGAWSARLTTHLFRRTLISEPDPRYVAFAQRYGSYWSPRMALFLQIQAVAAFLLAVTVFFAAHNPAPGLGWTDIAGILVLAGAILGESLADRQLRRFKADPANKGKVCDAGLWGWSRHPNYFFEWLGWLAYPVFAINLTDGYYAGFLTLIGPVFMYWLLTRVSGVPMLEREMLASKGAAYEAYQARVSAFIPLPPSGGDTTRPVSSAN